MVSPSCAAHLEAYSAPLLKANGHAMTLFSKTLKSPPFKWSRERYDTPDNDFFDADWLFPDEGRTPSDRFDGLLLIAHHGMGGSSNSTYIRRLAHYATSNGAVFVALNALGSSGEPNRNVWFYSAARTEELTQLTHICAERFPRARIFLVGYSLGGSIVANAVARDAAVRARIAGALTVCAPLDLQVSTARFEASKLCSAYTRYLLRTLRQMCADKAQRCTDAADAALLSAGSVAKTIREFDDMFTAHTRGHAGADEYYARESAFPHLGAVDVPLFFLHARDDPVVSVESGPLLLAEREQCNPMLDSFVTPGGGHCSFICRGNPHWLEQFIFMWCSDVATRGVPRRPSRPDSPTTTHEE